MSKNLQTGFRKLIAILLCAVIITTMPNITITGAINASYYNDFVSDWELQGMEEMPSPAVSPGLQDVPIHSKPPFSFDLEDFSQTRKLEILARLERGEQELLTAEEYLIAQKHFGLVPETLTEYEREIRHQQLIEELTRCYDEYNLPAFRLCQEQLFSNRIFRFRTVLQT